MEQNVSVDAPESRSGASCLKASARFTQTSLYSISWSEGRRRSRPAGRYELRILTRCCEGFVELRLFVSTKN